ncbi:MAG: hypothetical protein E6094_04300 [Clostridium perfringens]|nr:hypothetical protein [Clostridium perfringens]
MFILKYIVVFSVVIFSTLLAISLIWSYKSLKNKNKPLNELNNKLEFLKKRKEDKGTEYNLTKKEKEIRENIEVIKNEIDKCSYRYIHMITLYIIWLGLCVVIGIPILLLILIFRLKINFIDVIINDNNIKIIAINLFFYYIFSVWYLNTVFSNEAIKKISEKLNNIIFNFPKTLAKALIIPLILLFVIYLELYLGVLPLISLFGNDEVLKVVVVLSLFLFINKFFGVLIQRLFNFLKIKGKIKMNLKECFLEKSTENISLISILFLYIYGNTPELSSSIMTLGITTVLTIYGFGDKLLKWSK